MTLFARMLEVGVGLISVMKIVSIMHRARSGVSKCSVGVPR